jgi:hypothetical protein
MIVQRLAARSEPAGALSPTAVLRQALGCFWWLARGHMADRHGMPRHEALEPPPARWLQGWPRGRD